MLVVETIDVDAVAEDDCVDAVCANAEDVDEDAELEEYGVVVERDELDVDEDDEGADEVEAATDSVDDVASKAGSGPEPLHPPTAIPSQRSVAQRVETPIPRTYGSVPGSARERGRSGGDLEPGTRHGGDAARQVRRRCLQGRDRDAGAGRHNGARAEESSERF